MLTVRRQRVVLAFACALLALSSQPVFTEEHGRPVRRVEPEERRKIEELRREEEKRTDQKPVTAVEKAGREIDLTRPRNREFLDADALAKLTETDRTREVKFAEEIEKQMAERGWTEKEVRALLATERSGTSIDGTKRLNEPASVYGKSGEYVVVNDRTKEVIQVSNKKDATWKDDPRIQWK